jgi:subtilisin family serine protease
MTRVRNTSRPGLPGLFTRGEFGPHGRWSLIILLFLALASSLIDPAAAADPKAHHKNKLAPDLQEEVRKGSPSSTVRLVATLEEAGGQGVARKVAALGGRVRGHFRRVRQMALEVPLDTVEELAATDGVRYLVPDREVSALASQVGKTTGASLVYSGMRSGQDQDDETGVVAPVVVDGTSSVAGPADNSPTLTWLHTVGSGSDRLLVVGVSLRDGNTTVTGITYGGIPLSPIGFQTGDGNQNRTEMWKLLAPPTGTASVVVRLSSAKRIVGGAVSYFNVDQTTPHGQFASAAGTGDTAWVKVTSAPGEVVVNTVSTNGDAGSLTVDSDQSAQWSTFTGKADGGAVRGGGSSEPGDAYVVASWELGTAKAWSAGAVSLRPAGTVSAPSGGYDGTGVAVAVIDSGINAGLKDLLNETTKQRRVALAVDFTGTGRVDDKFGHGSHVAGTIAGDGNISYGLGRDFTGLAPGATLVNLRVLDDYGRGYISNVVAAIDYAIAVRSLYNIRVINLSLAAPPIDSYVDDPLCQAVARATSTGIVVVTAAGNFGQDGTTGGKAYGSITSPGISPVAITVGAVDTRDTVVRSDDGIAPFSSRGPTLSHATDPVTGALVYDFLAKPDLVAPGVRLVSLERDDNYLVKTYPVLHADGSRNNSRYMRLSGTSMSAAVVSGAAALILQANPSLTPNMVKAILMYTAQIMDGPDLFEQGSGMLNIDGAVRLARSLRPDAGSLPAGSPLADQPLPQPESTIADETFAWSQGLVWGFGALRGAALFTTQQEAYAQSLIWGLGRLSAWGAGVTYYDGLYSQTQVAFGQANEWQYVTWDSGTSTSSGLIWTRQLYASGVTWDGQTIVNDFFDASSSSLIWGRYGGACDGSGLIWGRFQSLIWGIR